MFCTACPSLPRFRSLIDETGRELRQTEPLHEYPSKIGEDLHLENRDRARIQSSERFMCRVDETQPLAQFEIRVLLESPPGDVEHQLAPGAVS